MGGLTVKKYKGYCVINANGFGGGWNYEGHQLV